MKSKTVINVKMFEKKVLKNPSVYVGSELLCQAWKLPPKGCHVVCGLHCGGDRGPGDGHCGPLQQVRTE